MVLDDVSLFEFRYSVCQRPLRFIRLGQVLQHEAHGHLAPPDLLIVVEQELGLPVAEGGAHQELKILPLLR